MTGHSRQGDQILCLIASDGWQFMPDYDALPAIVRRRLASSRYNLCAACVEIEARTRARSPTVKTFLEVIVAIERQLDRSQSS